MNPKAMKDNVNGDVMMRCAAFDKIFTLEQIRKILKNV